MANHPSQHILTIDRLSVRFTASERTVEAVLSFDAAAGATHVALFPRLAIFITVLAFNLLGDGLRDALTPKIDQQ